MADNTPNIPAGATPPPAAPKPGESGKIQPKKETVRINLPPKPTAAPTIKIPSPAAVAAATPAPAAPVAVPAGGGAPAGPVAAPGPGRPAVAAPTAVPRATPAPRPMPPPAPAVSVVDK